MACLAKTRLPAAMLVALLLWAAPAAASTITAVAGAPFSGTLASSAQTPQCPYAVVTSSVVTWGDGTTSLASVEVQQVPHSPSDVAFVASGTHTYVSAGSYAGSFTVEASCGDGDYTVNASGQFTATVTAAALTATGTPVSAAPGVGFTTAVAHLTDANPSDVASDFTATINWGDGTVSAGSVTAAAGGGFSISGSHIYQSAGQDVISVSVTSSGGSQASVNTTAIVAEPPSAPSAVSAPVRASFTTVGAASRGQVLLDASASAPSGTTATDYDWKLASAPGQDIVCPSSEPELKLNTLTATDTNVTLVTADAATGVKTTFAQQLAIPAPVHLYGRVASASGSSAVTVTGVCSGATTPQVPALSGVRVNGSAQLGKVSVGGAPPADCDQDLVFGAADVHGCLNQIPDPKDLPGGITTLISKLLCGAHDGDFCLTAGAIVGAARTLGSLASAGPTLTDTSSVEAALTKLDFPSYYSYDAIRLDGVDIAPQDGYPILIIPAAKAIVAPLVRVYIEGRAITPTSIPLGLYVPSSGGSLATITLPRSLPLIGSLPFNGSIAVTLNRAGATLSNGDTCQYACAALSVSAELPGVFSDGNGNGLSAAGVITADSVNGVQLDSLEVKVPSAQLAGIGVSNVDIRYTHSNDELYAQATINLFDAAGNITGQLTIQHGAFQAASVAWDAGNGPGIDLGGPLNIYLTHLGGSISLNPTTINATGTITGGPQYLGCALFGITGSMTATFGPFSFDANADGQLLCQNVSKEYFHIDDGGSILIGGQIDLNLLFFEFTGGLSIAGNVPQGHIQADANMSACVNILGSHCVGAEVVVSDRGIGLCADLGFTHAGGGIQFPDTVLFFTHTCDIGKFRSLGYVTRAGHVGPGFTVPRGQAVTVIGVTGSGAAPRVTLHGPHGQTIDTPAGGYEKTDQVVILADDKYTHETYFFLNHAPAGAWTISADPGSAQITGIDQASGLPSPAVHVSLRRTTAGELDLRYHLHTFPGQRVTFVEQDAKHRDHAIATAHGATGNINFTPSPLLANRRVILAEVTQNGQPRQDDTVAHYTVPPPAPLPAPTRLTAKRARSGLRLRWNRVSGADSYTVTAQLRDGTRRYVEVKQPRATLAQFPLGTGVTLTVRALAPGLRPRPGAPARLTLASTPRAYKVKVKPV